MTTENSGVRGWLWGPYSRLGLTVFLITLVLDQAHKWWMLEVFRIEERGRVTVTPFLDLVFVKNIGISYSMFDQESFAGQLMLAGFGLAATLALWIWLARGATGRLLAVSLGLIMGGAIGNAIDRCCSAGLPISSPCTPSGSTGMSSTSPMWPLLPVSLACYMTRCWRVAKTPQSRCSAGD